VNEALAVVRRDAWRETGMDDGREAIHQIESSANVRARRRDARPLAYRVQIVTTGLLLSRNGYCIAASP
jgi:hypothetical protein